MNQLHASLPAACECWCLLWGCWCFQTELLFATWYPLWSPSVTHTHTRMHTGSHEPITSHDYSLSVQQQWVFQTLAHSNHYNLHLCSILKCTTHCHWVSQCQTYTSHVTLNRVAMVMVSSHLCSDRFAMDEAGVIQNHDSHHDSEDDDDESRLVVDEGYSGMPSTVAPHRESNVSPLLSVKIILHPFWFSPSFLILRVVFV